MEYEIYKGEDELYHWGIRGMRWGVRRYQNKDGSLTDRGKKRLRAEQAKVREEEKTLKNRQAVKARLDRLEARKKAVEEGKKELDADKIKAKEERKAKKGKSDDAKKSLKDMTDEELAKAIERSRLEQQYNQLNPEPPAKQSLMTKLKNDVIVPAAMNSGKKFLENALNKAAEKVLGDKVDPNSLEALKKEFDTLDYKQRIDKIKNPDKYLSEEDKGKRQKREYDAEDRESQKRGYANVQAEAAAKRKAEKEAAAKQTTITEESPVPTKTSSPAVDAFINRVQNKPVSEVSSTKTRQQVQTKLESGDYDFKKWGRYDLDASRWDDDD